MMTDDAAGRQARSFQRRASAATATEPAGPERWRTTLLQACRWRNAALDG
jgi:hypothetical protein